MSSISPPFSPTAFKAEVESIKDINPETRPISWSLEEKAPRFFLLLINAGIHLHCHFQGLHFQSCFPPRPLCLLYAPSAFSIPLLIMNFQNMSSPACLSPVMPGLVPENKILAYLCYAVGREEQPRHISPPSITHSIYLYEMILYTHFYCLFSL